MSWAKAESAWQNLSDQIEEQVLQCEMLAARLEESFSGAGAKEIANRLANAAEIFWLIAEAAKINSQQFTRMRFAFAMLTEQVVTPENIVVNRAKYIGLAGDRIANVAAIAELDHQYRQWERENISAMIDYYYKTESVVRMLTGEDPPPHGGHGGDDGRRGLLRGHGGNGGGGNGGHGGLLWGNGGFL